MLNNSNKSLLEHLIDNNIVSYKEVTSAILGSINPSQVGTSIASKKTFQSHFLPRKCWENVRNWHFNQTGKCIDCGTRLDLQADHIIPREELGDNADYLDNMTLRCRRCNVTRRPSHKNGGQTFLSSESALMWLHTRNLHYFVENMDLLWLIFVLRKLGLWLNGLNKKVYTLYLVNQNIKIKLRKYYIVFPFSLELFPIMYYLY